MNGTSNSPANKLLVMIDGRSVHSPLFSGVFWDEPDVMLEDVERIEVISGLGGTLWGVNAVNGVINITTRRAADTRGDLAVLRADEDPVGTLTAGLDPAYTAQLRANWAIDAVRELEVAVRHAGAILPMVGAYTALDARFGWRVAPGMDVSVIGTNLNGGHAEYGSASIRTEVPRTVGIKLVWQK